MLTPMDKGFRRFYVQLLAIPLLLGLAFALALRGSHTVDAVIIGLLIAFYVALAAFWLRLWKRDRDASR
jgi:membrane-associated PAP2 superfamily phosphatase